MIVVEHIIQAADVAHAMQHWQVYTKWNERLFQELYLAYEDGRSEKDPSEGWYGGEIWFFDNYVIPLARKLEECGVFGVTSDECLNEALENRKEWEVKDKELVKYMAERVQLSRKTSQIGGKVPDSRGHEILFGTSEEGEIVFARAQQFCFNFPAWTGNKGPSALLQPVPDLKEDIVVEAYLLTTKDMML
jgi:hypothetical protein